MMFIAVRLGLTFAALSLVMTLPARAEDMADDGVAKGRAIAEQNCARCHALGANDKSQHDKAPPFREVAKRYPADNLAEALAEGIVSGHPDMPVFVLSPSQIDAFIGYLESLNAASGAGTPSAP